MPQICMMQPLMQPVRISAGGDGAARRLADEREKKVFTVELTNAKFSNFYMVGGGGGGSDQENPYPTYATINCTT